MSVKLMLLQVHTVPYFDIYVHTYDQWYFHLHMGNWFTHVFITLPSSSTLILTKPIVHAVMTAKETMMKACNESGFSCGK